MLFLALSCVSTSSSSFGTSQLRCEGGDPWGSSAAAFAIDTPFPTFTWANTHSAVRGATQRSFEFELREHRRSGAMPLVWNSGAVESNASTFTYPATAPALRSATTYAFNVRYTDGGGAISAWASEPSLLHFAAPDWSSVKWIGSDTTNVYRSSFQLPADPIESAVVYACGLGYAYVRVNGAAAGVEGEKRMIVTSPWSNNAKRNGYSALDVTKQLVVGAENVVAVGLGHGWRPNDPFSRHDPSWSGDTTDRVLKLQLVVTGKDGKQTIFAVTGAGTWTTAVGPSTMDSVYNGETYDASLAQVGWDAPKFVPATSWTNAAVVAGGPTGVMSAWAAPPVLIDGAPIAPINITNPYPQIFVVDFGVNQAGVSQLNDLSVFKLKKGDTITMKHAEILEHEFLPGVDAKDYEKMIYQGNLRSAKATDTYIAKGGDTGSWFPRLTYHGFRYVEVTLPVGSPSLSADQISMLHFHSAVKEKVTEASFSSPIITAIQKLAQGAQRSNLMSVPTDCDQRDERLGWMGDMALSSDSICLNFDCGAFAKSFIRAMDDEMGSDGSLPDVVPFVRFGNRPGDVSWSDAFIQTSYVLFKETGDLEMAKTYFTDFTRQIGNVVAQAKAGLDHMHTPYGDWCPPPAVAGGGQGPKPSAPYTSAVSYIHMVQQTAELAGAIGNTSEATRLSAMAASLLTDFNTAFLHNDGPPPSPTCASVDEAKTAILSCAAPGKIATVAYAGFGTLTAGCPSLAKGSCFADLSAAVRTACVGKLVCTVVCTGGEGCIVNGAAVNVTDPCYGTKKTVSVSITCSGAPPAPGPPPTPTKSYDTGMMTSVALAIEIGAANAAGSAVNSSALESLSLLMTAHMNHHTTGIIGYKVLHEALRAGGHEDQALANLENSDYPSIGYMIANEFEPATENLWELLDGFHEGNGMNSRNHHMWSSYSKYVVQRLGGLAHDGATKEALMTPASTLGLSAANITLALAHGSASLHWRRHGGTQCAKIAAGHAATLDCGASGGVISAVNFASFGTPTGVCGAFEAHPQCDSAASSVTKLSKLCVGKKRCEIPVADAATFGHPGTGCSTRGGEAWFTAEVQCSAPVQVHTSVTLPIGSTGTVVFPLELYGSSDATISEAGAALNIGAGGAAIDGIHGVRRGVDHANRAVLFAEVGAGTFEFVVSL